MIKNKGLFYALFTSLISGLAIFYNKLIAIKGIDPLLFNIFKNGSVAIILSSIILVSSYKKALFNLEKKQWLKLIMIGFIGGSIPFILFFEGLGQTSSLNANLIHKTLFVWSSFLAISFLGEKLNIKQIIGYFAIILSNFVIGGFRGFAFSQGEIFIFLATIFWAIESIIVKIALKNTKAILIAWGRMFIGSIILLLVATAQNKLSLFAKIQQEQIPLIFISVLFLTAYILTYYKALKKLPVTQTTAMLVLATPITNILTTVFINQTNVKIHFLHLGIVIASVLAVYFFAGNKKRSKPSISLGV